MKKYVAFLRGINSGKNPRTKMEDLKLAFENLGFENIKTVIASGNVIFDSKMTDINKLESILELKLPATLGFKGDTFVTSADELHKLFESDPFKSIALTKDTKPYITFIKSSVEKSVKFPIEGDGFKILNVSRNVVCSIIDINKTKTPDFMKVIDKLWKPNTTRGLKTIERILKLCN